MPARGRRKSTLAVAAIALAITATAANAADLGGDCCADLEERVAELEATTARKGNRKVSLTVSGYIAQEITVWDDGKETNTYIHGLGPTQTSHVKFNGQAKIAPGWTAGYMLRIQDLTGNAFSGGLNGVSQLTSTRNDNLNTQMSFWYLQSDTLGKVSVGRAAQAAKSVGMFTDLSGTQIIDNYTFLDGFPNFRLRSSSGVLSNTLTWGQLGFCYTQGAPLGGDCNGIVMNGVRYDTPTFAGFSASASWGEDDFWEVAARYSGEVSGFKIAAGVGYAVNTDENTSFFVSTAHKDSAFFQAGAYVQHLATGLFLHGIYGNEDNNGTALTSGKIEPNSHQYYVKAGIRRKVTPLGATIVYGDYARYIDQLGPVALNEGATGSTLERFGGGIAQEIDAAAMTVYLKYQHYQADLEGVPRFADLEDADFVSFGALINF